MHGPTHCVSACHVSHLCHDNVRETEEGLRMYQYVEDGRGVLNVYYCILVYMVNVRISHVYHKYSSILYGRGLIDIKEIS